VINESRENYRSVARRGSVLYFVVADLALIDPMYQYSLEFFARLFNRRLDKAAKSEVLEERINGLLGDITASFYTNICRGLFEKDKLLYSFLNAASILRRGGEIGLDEWNCYLRGSPTDFSSFTNEADCISDRTFRKLLGLEEAHFSFKDIAKSFADPGDAATWKRILAAEDPQLIALPPLYEDRLTAFQKLMLLRVLREEKLLHGVKSFVSAELGAQFIESPPFDLDGAAADSTNTTPVIFVLSPGADPIADLIALAKSKGMETRLKILSLGQGQGAIAARLVDQGQKTGDWVCLQNCHLSASWMPELEKTQERQDENTMHPDYRLWLTSMPSEAFPVPVLQSGIKLTNEPPRGLKANLKRTYADVSEEEFESCAKPREYKKLLFALAYFHAAILERRKYGAIGWNIPYAWMTSDFETSKRQLRMYLDEQEHVPYQALNYLVSACNYGGRVTDDKDVILIGAMLKRCFCPEVMNDSYRLSKLETYVAPPEGPLADTRTYIEGLPLDEDPEVFGLHPNANIAFELRTVGDFTETILMMQPRVASAAGGRTPDELAQDLCREIAGRLPQLLDTEKAHPQTFAVSAGRMGSLGVFVGQEIGRFNDLLSVMKSSLSLLDRAIEGTVVMSVELEAMAAALLSGNINPVPFR
jgi:dynein heavy chain